MGLAELCVRRPVFATMLIMVLVVVGLVAFRELGIDLYPKVDFPTVTITTVLPGASAEELETEVTKQIEEAVNTIQGIDEMRSVTVEGVSQVYVTFLLERDIESAAQDVRDKVSAILRRLPDGIDPPVIEKLDPDASPIMSISVAGDRSMREITEIADKQIKQQLESVAGIGQVILLGGRQRAIQIEIDADKMNSLSVPVTMVAAALQRENLEIPGGRIDQGQRELVLRTLGRISTPELFGAIIVAQRSGTPVRIRDFATVTDSWEEPRDLARLDGRPAVTLLVRKQSGTNTVEIVRTVKSQLAGIRTALPPDLSVSIIRDQSEFIEGSVNAIYEHLLLGGLFASVVVFFFMRNIRATLIAAVAIPTSIITTFAVMRWLDYTLNSMTLLALTVAVGIVIDDAIVVLENIFRFIEEKHYTPFQAAIEGTKEIAMAVTATTLSLVVVFAPVMFLYGIPGRFLRSFGVTAAVAIMVSLLVSFTLTPMLCSRWIRKKDVEAASATEHGSSKESGFYRWLEDTYIRSLEWSLAHRWAVLGIGAVTLISIVPISSFVGKDFFPYDDQDEFEVMAKMPEGTSLQGSDTILVKIEEQLRKLPEVRHLLTTVNSGGQGSVTDGSIYVRLTPLKERKTGLSQFAIMDRARKEIQSQYPGVRISVQNVNAISGGGFRNTPVNIVLRGPDLARLTELSGEMLERMKKAPGIVDADSSLNVGNPEVQVHILRDKAADLGVSAADIAQSLRLMISGEVEITKYKEGDELYEVRTRVKPEQRGKAGNVAGLMIPAAGGRLVRLDNVARVERGTGPAQIDRYNRQRQVLLSSNMATGYALGDAINSVVSIVKEVGLPPGYDYFVIGRGKIFQELMVSFGVAVGLSLVFMYMVLAAQFESFVHPITILSSLPLAVPFGLLSLALAGKTLHMFSALGILLLFGVVKKNSILQVDFTNRLREQGRDRHDAIIEANRARLRPILMTTISIIAGMIPTALGTGAGSGSRSAIATVIVGGQTMCFLLTLLAVPVLYTVFDDLRGKAKERAAARSEVQVEA